MRTVGRMLAIAGTAAAVLATTPTTASAGSDSIHGGCFFDTDTPPGSTTATGVIGDSSVTLDSNNQPTAATVSCGLEINGTIDPTTVHSYAGFAVQAGADQLTFTDTPPTNVISCERVQYADGVDTNWNCIHEPPPPPPDPLDPVFAALSQFEIDNVDPVVCPVLVANAGVYGPVEIRADGDVYVTDPIGLGLNPIYDCPPYGNF